MPTRLTKKPLRIPWLPEIISAAGLLIFFAQLWTFAHTQHSVLDEGLYLFKGFLFASGRYQLFQDYGPLTNQMPVAFLIPGSVQTLLGPGLRVGRYFAIFLGLFMLLALWLTSRRLGSRWLAAAAVWAMAVNPAAAKMYSMAISEGLIACLLMWVMFLTLGEKRPFWQILAGSILSGLIIMIRINLLPLLPFLILYHFWQRGWKTAAWAALAGALTVALIHALYWPNILRLWAYWLPEGLAPFLSAFRPPDASPYWDPAASLAERVSSFWEAVRYYFAGMIGALASWLFWPRKSQWKSQADFRIAVFLSVLLVSLIALHAWASLIKNYCVFCFPIYTSFYAGLGLLLAAVSIPSWQKAIFRWQLALAGLATVVVPAGILYSRWLPLLAYKVMEMRVPRINNHRILPGYAELWRLIANVTSLQQETIFDIFNATLPIVFGLLAGWIFWQAARLLPRVSKRPVSLTGLPTGVAAFALMALIGCLLAPSDWLGGGYQRYDCGGDEIATYEAVGTALQAVIPPTAQVFWRSDALVDLLYLPQAGIYPSQLNGDYSYRLTGEDDELLKYGWWNETLGRRWLAEAEFVLVEPKYYEGWLQSILESGLYDELSPTPSNAPCRAEAYLRIFKRKP